MDFTLSYNGLVFNYLIHFRYILPFNIFQSLPVVLARCTCNNPQVLPIVGQLFKEKTIYLCSSTSNDMKKEAKCGKFSYCFPREPSPPWPHRIKVFHLVSLSALLREMSSQNPENTAGTDLCGPRQQYGRTRDPCKSRRKFSLFWCKFCGVLEIMC